MDTSREKASPEWETIVECSALLIDSIKGNIDNMGNEFHSKWFLSESEYESLKQVGPGSEPSIRARKIISAVECRVKSRPALFEDFIAVLRSQGEWMHDCTRKVEECYKGKQLVSSEESEGPGFVCPYCQKCTLEDFFMSGCPQEKAEKTTPSISSPTFPYLDTKRLSEPEKHMLLDKLTTDYESIVSAFRKLCLSLSKSPAFKDEIDSVKLFLSASAIFSKEEKMQLMSSKTMTQVLMILLLERASFFNHQTIELVVNEYGSSEDKREMQKYLDEFNSYCKHNVFEVPHAVFHPGQNEDSKHSKFALKYFEEGPIMLQQITKLCNRIAKTLHINSWALSLESIQKGCVFLTFSIPVSIATNVLPISDAQLIELSRFGLGAIDEEEDESRSLDKFSDLDGTVTIRSERKGSTKRILAEVDLPTNEEEATDVTGESGYGTGEEIRQNWIQGRLQTSSSADPGSVSVKDANQYTSLCATFSGNDSGPYSSLVKSSKLVPADAQQEQMGMRYAYKIHSQTIQWLCENFEASEGCNVSKKILYDHYLRHCATFSIDPVNAVVFGKLIRSVFIGLTTRKLGTSGNFKTGYYGIWIKPDSPLRNFPTDDDDDDDITSVPVLPSLPSSPPSPPYEKASRQLPPLPYEEVSPLTSRQQPCRTHFSSISSEHPSRQFPPVQSLQQPPPNLQSDQFPSRPPRARLPSPQSSPPPLPKPRKRSTKAYSPDSKPH